MNEIISVRSLTKKFLDPESIALDNVSFSVLQGEFCVVVGPDAAGKTTLCRILSGIMEFDSGNIDIFGLSIVSDTIVIQQEIGYVTQKFSLYEELSVLENINLYAKIRGLSKEEYKHRVEQMLSITSLDYAKHRLAGKLSGGMKQKLSLICGLISHPKLLILDEVSVGVDPISRKDLINTVKDMIKDGCSVIWATSCLEDTVYADKVLLLHEGRQIYFGNPSDFLKNTTNKVFLIKNDGASRTDAITTILSEHSVLDIKIVNDYFRLLINGDIEKKENYIQDDLNFEDAYMVAINAQHPLSSRLADIFENRQSINDHIIEATNLTKKFGDFIATNNVNFKINAGEIFGFLGPNGAGKSTTFKMLCGLIRPTFGQAIVDGISLIESPSEARKKIGYMAQKFSLYGELNVVQNLEFFGNIYGISRKVLKGSVYEIIDILELGDFAHMDSSLLPLGIKQRLALACSVIHKPVILFLDEPTSGADPVSRREFWLHINALADKGVTIMVTTHFMEEAEYCDRVAIIFNGLKIAEGTPRLLKQMAVNELNKNPTFEDAFIHIIKSNSV